MAGHSIFSHFLVLREGLFRIWGNYSGGNWKDKNHNKTPWIGWGLRPGARLPAGAYKSKLLTPQPKPYPHLLSEGCQPLQGDKQEINPFFSEEVHCSVVYFHSFSMMISAGWGLFPVYRLVLDAKPDRMMPCLTGNHWACSGIFWQTRYQMSR